MSVVMMGGGIDSATLLYDMARSSKYRKQYGNDGDIHAIMVDFGQTNYAQTFESTRAVLNAAPDVAERVKLRTYTVDLPGAKTKAMCQPGYQPPMPSQKIINGYDYFGSHSRFNKKEWANFIKVDWVQGRMTCLLFMAAMHAVQYRMKYVYTGFQLERQEREDFDRWVKNPRTTSTMWYSDQDPQFTDRFEVLLRQGVIEDDYDLRFVHPWMDQRMNKEAIFQLAIKHGLPIESTYTCYYVPRCGHCIQCLRLYYLGAKYGVKVPPAPYANKAIVDSWVADGSIYTRKF